MADQDFNIRVVTTADTKGVQQTSAAMDALRQKEQAADERAAQETGTVIGQLIGRLAGFGLIYEGLNNIRQVASEVAKTSAELDKMGGMLVEHAQHFAQAARAVTSEDDALNIGKAALKDIDAIQLKIRGTLAEEVSLTGKWVDSAGHLVAQFTHYGQASENAGRINQQMLDERLRGEQLLSEQADIDARRAIESSEKMLAKYRELQNLPFRDAFDKVNTDLEAARQKQDNLDKKAADYVSEYVKAGVEIQNLLKILTALEQSENRRATAAREATKAHQEEDSFMANALKTSSAQVQATLANEDAARRAAAAGQGRDADLYQKTAEQLKAGMTQAQRDEYEGLTSGGQQRVIDAINDLKNQLIGIWR